MIVFLGVECVLRGALRGLAGKEGAADAGAEDGIEERGLENSQAYLYNCICTSKRKNWRSKTSTCTTAYVQVKENAGGVKKVYC